MKRVISVIAILVLILININVYAISDTYPPGAPALSGGYTYWVHVRSYMTYQDIAPGDDVPTLEYLITNAGLELFNQLQELGEYTDNYGRQMTCEIYSKGETSAVIQFKYDGTVSYTLNGVAVENNVVMGKQVRGINDHYVGAYYLYKNTSGQWSIYQTGSAVNSPGHGMFIRNPNQEYRDFVLQFKTENLILDTEPLHYECNEEGFKMKAFHKVYLTGNYSGTSEISKPLGSWILPGYVDIIATNMSTVDVYPETVDYEADVNVLLPRDGFIDNSLVFSIWTNTEISKDEYFEENLLEVDVLVDGIEQTYGNELLVQSSSFNDLGNSIIHNLRMSLTVGVGEHDIDIVYKYDGEEIGRGSISIERLGGFVDEDGDGLDDRTGRTDNNTLPSEQYNQDNSLKGIIGMINSLKLVFASFNDIMPIEWVILGSGFIGICIILRIAGR